MRTDLDVFVDLLLDAKREEEQAKAERIKLEEQIAALVPGPATGQKTVKLDDGTSITVKRGLNYKADFDELVKVDTGEFPAPIKTKTTRELDVAAYEWFRSDRPEIFCKMVDFVSVTPKKVSVEVKKK